jgi:hypothetical protein
VNMIGAYKVVYDEAANVVNLKEPVRASTRHEAFRRCTGNILCEGTHPKNNVLAPFPVVQRSLPLFNAHHRHHRSICRHAYLVSVSVSE